MTVKELMDRLSAFPDHMSVYVAERKTDFAYGLVNSVTTAEINFTEEPGGEVEARDTVVIIDEE